MVHVYVCAHVCARVCMRVCMCVRVCMINENKHYFQSFCYLINYIVLIHVESSKFFSCETILFYFYAQVMGSMWSVRLRD